MLKKYASITFLILLVVVFFNCETENGISNIENRYDIIPNPVHLTPKAGHFILNENTKIVLADGSESFIKSANLLKQKIMIGCGFDIEISEGNTTDNAIIFTRDDSVLNDESYFLSVTSSNVTISAKEDAGAFYALQTIRQLLPNAIEGSAKEEGISWNIPAVEIKDNPRFSYRGMHLDVGRHFFPVATVKRFLDLMAYHKLNRFHWHLTEDQGWRIEIKKYPKLTEVGAYRNETLVGHYNDQPHQFDGKRYGGFYTQEEVKEVVEYAAERFITVIPEIEMPGHSLAAIAAYPELGCTDNQYEVGTKWGIYDKVYCPTEQTFQFLEDVLTEVMELFPSQYIHIGGDECPKTQWKASAFCQHLMKQEGLKNENELQSYFIKRIEKFLNENGRNIIGWDEILEGGLAPNATVMSWRGIEGGIEAAKAGHNVIMTPTSHCYFDYYQSDHPDEPLAIGGFLPLEKVYHYEPIPEALTKEESVYVLGTQANLWTEYIPTEDKLEYMAFPRLSALSEVAWSAQENRNFKDFVGRLSPHIQRLELMGVNVANHLYDLKSSIQPKNGKVELSLEKLAKDGVIYYTIDGSEPTSNSLLYDAPIPVETNLQVKAKSHIDEGGKGRLWEQSFNIHKAAGKTITLKLKPAQKYSGGGEGSIINGVLGSNVRYGDAEWLGFEGIDFEGTIDFGREESLNDIVFRFFNGQGQWIYLPQSIELFTSTDGINFETLLKNENISGETNVVETKVALDNVNTQYLKIMVKNFGTIPEGRQGGGHKAWLFIDEIQVN